LIRALQENANMNRGIRFRQSKGGDRDIKRTYVLWGTTRMDKNFPQDISKEGGTWRDGHKYAYGFDFGGRDTMKSLFMFGIRDQIPSTIELIEESCKKHKANIPKANKEGCITLQDYDSTINLNRVFSYEEVLSEVNRQIDQILELEGKVF
jgi:hypothetical protein